MLSADLWHAAARAAPDYRSFERHYQIDWVRWMCDLVGVFAPADEDCVGLGHAATRYIMPRVRAAFPGVVAAIQTLRQQGYVLHTASGASSGDLDGYLQGMGVRACFDRLYGPDLLDTFKDGPRFYERMFADASVAPQNALVVDDNATAVGWAAQVGANTVLLSAAPPATTHAHGVSGARLSFRRSWSA
jgi:HAD superfamily hydrolase (TIGR01509 family)